LDKQTKSAFIAITGRPNVGKSSLLNAMVGCKIAIVSSKPQTTRTKIMGVLTEGETQLVFVDTPGFHKPKTQLGENMMKTVKQSVSDVECVLLVVEAALPPGPAERELIGRFQEKSACKVFLVLNKIDLLKQKAALMERIAQYTELYPFDEIIPLSALDGDGVPLLMDKLFSLAAPAPHFFESDDMTDQPEKVMAGEIIREKILNLTDKEVPHGIAVSVEKMRERPEGGMIDLEAVIYCEKESHKGMIIGKQGAMLKKIGSLARADLEAFFQSRFNVQLWVKVKEDWRNRPGLIRSFGLDS